jgi:TetR/AcrR family transcriptional regulator, cholesterol catabolism regulator
VPKEASNIARRRSAALTGGKSGYVDRRREIFQAAAEVFKERGFRGTTLSHVAEAMGTDRASLYYYVSSKDELFQEVVSEAVNVNLAAATAIRDEDGPAPDKLRRLIEGLMASYAAYYPVLYVLIQENLSHVAPEHSEWAQEMKRINREYERLVIEIIEAGQKEGTFRDSAPAWLLAYGVIGIVGWSNRWFNPNKSPVSAEEIGVAFADVLLTGLTVQPAAGTRSRRRKSQAG